MSELIDRQHAANLLYKMLADDYVDGYAYLEQLRSLPSVESERKAKAIEHDASVTDTNGYKYHRSENLCGACKKRVLGVDEYCSHCGAKIDWSSDE